MHTNPFQLKKLYCTRSASIMRRALASLGTVLLFCLCAPSMLIMGAAPALAAEAAPFWSAGKTQVFVIQDRPGEMPVELFSGPATPEERAGYFTDGKAPASINVFLIRIDGKNILVDTGFGTVAPGKSALIPALDSLGLAPESIDLAILTHMHMDHAGGLLINKKRAFPKANIMVAKPELEYWLGLAEKDPANANAALVRTITEEYGKDILAPFSFGDAILPGVTALDASGHTPGHTAFLVESEGKQLLIVGDLVHAAALQFPLPEECARYDIDTSGAVKSRIAIMTLAAEKGLSLAGMHIPHPGHGKVTKMEKGFSFIPSKSEKN